MFTIPTTYFEKLPPDPHLMIKNQVVSITDTTFSLSSGTWSGYKILPPGVTTLYMLLIGSGQGGGADYSGSSNTSGWSGGCWGVKLTSQIPGTHFNITMTDPTIWNPPPGPKTTLTGSAYGGTTTIIVGSYQWEGNGGGPAGGSGGSTIGSPPNYTFELGVNLQAPSIGSGGHGGAANAGGNISFGPLSFTNNSVGGANGVSTVGNGAGYGAGGGTSYGTTVGGGYASPGCVVFAW